MEAEEDPDCKYEGKGYKGECFYDELVEFCVILFEVCGGDEDVPGVVESTEYEGCYCPDEEA